MARKSPGCLLPVSKYSIDCSNKLHVPPSLPLPQYKKEQESLLSKMKKDQERLSPREKNQDYDSDGLNIDRLIQIWKLTEFPAEKIQPN